MIRKILVVGVAIAALLGTAACTQSQQRTAAGATVGAGAGAVIGGVTTGTVQGAAIGAAIGGVAGALVGQVAGQPDQCYYRAADGRLFIDDCPPQGMPQG